jgi:predicted GNAT superfamily acetyltransferase
VTVIPRQSEAGPVVAPVPPEYLVDCQELDRVGFGFRDIDVRPAWSMYTVTLIGGLVIGAFDQNRLVGFLYAVPGYDGRQPFLYADGLVTLPDFRSRGIGRRLVAAFGETARQRGYPIARWNADTLGSHALYLYLSAGARIVGLHPEMYDQFQPYLGSDEVFIEWDLAAGDAPSDDRSGDPISVVVETNPRRDGVRELSSWPRGPEDLAEHGPPPYEVELPWDIERLRSQAPDVAQAWRLGMRETTRSLLGEGLEGVQVTLDRREKRSFIRFVRADSPAHATAGEPASPTPWHDASRHQPTG